MDNSMSIVYVGESGTVAGAYLYSFEDKSRIKDFDSHLAELLDRVATKNGIDGILTSTEFFDES